MTASASGSGDRDVGVPDGVATAPLVRTTPLRVDSGRGQERTLRGVAPVECAIDGWSLDGEELGKVADGILAGGMHAAEFPLLSVGQFGLLAA